MSILSRLRGAFGLRGLHRGTPRESGAPLVPDRPKAAPRPTVAPDPSDGFEADDAPCAVGVLQWTSALLVNGGLGPGSWDFIDLVGWDTADMSTVISELGSSETGAAELTLGVGNALRCRASLTPGTWVFSRADCTTWWTAPLFVVHTAQ